MKNLLWCEGYRPETVNDCILPERLKIPFQEYVNKKEIPNLLIHGSPGVGKTTIALAMCKEVGCDHMVINGSNENGIDTFRTKILSYASSMSLAGGRKVIIIDEADYLNPNSIQPALRNALDEFSTNCTFIFTCNYPTRIIEPLHSRCAVIDFQLKGDEKTDMANQFFKKIKTILDIEGITYDFKVLIEVVKKYFPDFRRTINELQRYSQFGKIDLGLLSQLGNVNINDVVSFVKDKNFGAIRKWVAINDVDNNTVFRQIYDGLYENMKPQSIPQAVIILADYQYKQAFVADPQINLVACLTELMASCEFV